MSVSAQETVFHHVGNGVSVTFAFNCQVLLAADLNVYVNDVLTTSGFTVSGIGTLTGGSVTFDTPPANLVAVRLERVVALERTTDYQQNGDFLTRVVNPDFNRIWMALQQHLSTLNRAIKVPKSEAVAPPDLPTAAARANKLLSFDAFGNPVAVAPAAQSATALQLLLATSSGAGMVGMPNGGELSDAVLHVTPMMMGGVGNGIADDTTALHAAFVIAHHLQVPCRLDGKIYRVTSGFLANENYADLLIDGGGASIELSAQKSRIILDSADPAAFFYSMTGRHHFQVKNCTLQCAQYALDRPFIKFQSSLYRFQFDNVDFENVEQPFVFYDGSYFQNSSLRNVQFRSSGTLHSKAAGTVGNLIGTFLRLDNVNHEGAVPVNTEKKVCNLTGIRYVNSSSFLLEGFLPSAGWTILKLANPYDAYYTRAVMASFSWFHSEWSGAFPPLYVVDQVGGTVQWIGFAGITAAIKYKMSSLAKVVMDSVSFSGTLDEPSTFFERENGQCVVAFENCQARTVDTKIVGIHHHNTQWASSVDGQGQVMLSNDAAQELWKWDGGYLGDVGDVQLLGYPTNTPSTDATYGRKWLFTPAAGTLGTAVKVKTKGMLVPGDQIVVSYTAKLPNFTAGLWAFGIQVDGVGIINDYHDVSKAGTVVTGVIPLVLTTTPTTVGASLAHGTSTGAVSDLEIYQLSIHQGLSISRVRLPVFPRNINTYAAAAPVAGAWLLDDHVDRVPSVVGQPKGWKCTATGTPGTWVSDGNR